MNLDFPLQLLVVLHYTYPLAVFLCFAVTSITAICLPSLGGTIRTHTKKFPICCCLFLFIGCFCLEGALEVAEVIIWHHWPSEDAIVSLLLCILVFGMELDVLTGASNVIWYRFYGSWVIALLCDLANIVLLLAQIQNPSTNYDRLPVLGHAFLVVVRCVLMLSAFKIYFSCESQVEHRERDSKRSLLSNAKRKPGGGNTVANGGYGASSSATSSIAGNTEKGNWLDSVRKFSTLFPYIWPANNRCLQLRVGLVGLCLLAENTVNFLQPRQYGAVIDSLNGASAKDPWVQVAVFTGLQLLSSDAGIPLVRQFLWKPLKCYSEEALTVAAYSHIMNLSLAFHNSKSSSDLNMALLNAGTVSGLLEVVCFRTLPALVDLVVAFTYLLIKFGPYEGFIIVVTVAAFVQTTSRSISVLREQRRGLVESHLKESSIRQSGITGWETIVAHNGVSHQNACYSEAVGSYIRASQSVSWWVSLTNALRSLTVLAGQLAGALLVVYQVTNGRATAGDFIMLLTYWSRFTSPITFFSSLGGTISQILMNTEKLLEIMQAEPTVIEKPDAEPLQPVGGQVELVNVYSSYDRVRDVLRGLHLFVPPGTIVALVGMSGAGKSTILRLLSRFYDVTKGAVRIDGQDIRDVTLSSIHECIGIVPQNPFLFEGTVLSNVRCARLAASDKDVYNACKAAAIHDQICRFPDGYDTEVGERGVRLSGGEVQRIAIARAFLQKPSIVLLDEATSSVDTVTEQKIQEGLRALCQGRTTFIVA
ncbi:Uu.00g024430.m01.CDS01 [Anthostomella pinea]|uniref:Uu.00g024430.m01.CDS01 n=1 Tax=Anthostomella pinea TaxID=933095 RepID=A0AAI8W0W7_9PEZI|nr:Uu.00g024430.m01.CDS01 [Anthostomella pinea]